MPYEIITKSKPLLPKNSITKLPNNQVREVCFEDLTAMSLKVWLYVVYLWQKKERKEMKPSLEDFHVSFSWQELAQHLSPTSSRAMDAGNYTTFRAALGQLDMVRVRHSTLKYVGKGFKIREAYTLIGGWKLDDESLDVRVSLGIDFRRILEILGQGGNFTLVPLEEVFKLNSPRHVRMLMWAAMFEGLNSEDMRTLSLDTIKHSLGLKGTAYDDWRQISINLREYASAVSKRTNFKVKLIPIKDGRKVVAVRFDVKRKPPKVKPQEKQP